MAYPDKFEQIKTILGHVRQLQKASYFVLAGLDAHDQDLVDRGDNVVSFGAQNPESLFENARNNSTLDEHDIENCSAIMVDAELAFKKLTRKGFEENILDDPVSVEGFRIGAGALLKISSQLETFLSRMKKIDRENSSLEKKFVEDKKIFSQQFNLLYGGAL